MIERDRAATPLYGGDEDKNLKGPAASEEASQLPSSLKLEAQGTVPIGCFPGMLEEAERMPPTPTRLADSACGVVAGGRETERDSREAKC
jgi:hypothetical protein